MYLNEGICTKSNCNYRHPRVCSYWLNNICFRGESCCYNHNDATKNDEDNGFISKDTKNKTTGRIDDTCDRYDKKTTQRYYCEYCKCDFCPECIKKEVANIEGIEKDSVDCHLIHERVNENVEENDDKSIGYSNCQCGNMDGENFKCKDCTRIFCRSCPSGPIPQSETLRCLECLFSETTEMYTSTPEKRQIGQTSLTQ